MEVLNGYELTTELKNDNSGFARWGFAKKNGTEYFIKEFLTPIYPLDTIELSKKQVEIKREICNEFEMKKRAFYKRLNQCSTGNIVTVTDFFRHMNKYYIVTEKIDAEPMEPVDISVMGEEQKLLIVKVILYCVNSLHMNGIVHGDIKPDNILFKKTMSGMYTAKIIDFDSSFVSGEMPEDEDIQGDMVYLAPETFLMMAEGETVLTTKIDVFALGILFHQYFSGELPAYNSKEYDYVFEAVLDGDDLEISEKIPGIMADVIKKMLDKNPENRPGINEVFKLLMPGVKKEIDSVGGFEEKTENTENMTGENVVVTSSRLKITMRSRETTELPEKVEIKEKREEGSGQGFFRKPDDLL